MVFAVPLVIASVDPISNLREVVKVLMTKSMMNARRKDGAKMELLITITLKR